MGSTLAGGHVARPCPTWRHPPPPMIHRPSLRDEAGEGLDSWQTWGSRMGFFLVFLSLVILLACENDLIIPRNISYYYYLAVWFKISFQIGQPCSATWPPSPLGSCLLVMGDFSDRDAQRLSRRQRSRVWSSLS